MMNALPKSFISTFLLSSIRFYSSTKSVSSKYKKFIRDPINAREAISLLDKFEVFQNTPPIMAQPKKRPLYIYANTEIHMDSIDVVGFDYDFTLVHYTGHLQELIYDIARNFLIEKMGYSKDLRALKYDPSFGIRGLMFDVKKYVFSCFCE